MTLPNGVSTEYQYDLGSRLSALVYRNARGPLGDLQYSYDAAGNRTSVGGSFARTLVPSAVTSATYDAANRQLAFGTAAMAFDDTGNLLTQTDGSGTLTYTWDARNRLVALNGPTLTASFAYDGLGRRAQTTINSVLTQYRYDGLDAVTESSGGNTVSYLRTLGIDEALVRTEATDSTHYLGDALGSSVALTTAGGSVGTTYTYAPFGETTTAGPSSPNPFRFTGREDDGTGLYYYRARYYDPTRSRFVSEDPIGLVGGDTNFYVYVRNAPTVYIDSLGLDLAVIESGPTQANPIGHTAIAITGHGVFSRGNDVAPGSSLAAYLAREAPKRNTTVTVIRTTLADDAAALASLQASFPRPLGKIWDNCASTSNEALDAARIPNRPWGWSPVPYPGSLPGTAGWRASEAGGTPISIPKGSTAVPSGLSPFEPRVAR